MWKIFSLMKYSGESYFSFPDISTKLSELPLTSGPSSGASGLNQYSSEIFANINKSMYLSLSSPDSDSLTTTLSLTILFCNIS